MSPIQHFARAVLALAGWKMLDGPPLPAKAVLLGYPHTSNWDLAVTLAALAALGVKPRWVGKDTMFRGWRGPIVRALGGIPVNRREATGLSRQGRLEPGQSIAGPARDAAIAGR